MAGLGSVGSYGMPDYQFKSAMMSTAGFAAQGTGTAKQHSNKLEEQLQPKQQQQDGVTLSQNAELSLSDDAQELQQNQKADQQKELKDKSQDQNKIGQEYSSDNESQELTKSDSMEKKLQEMRMKQNAGHAAMATGSKPKESEKTEKSHVKSQNVFAKASSGGSKPEESSSSAMPYDYKSMMDDLNQAAHLGILEGEAKKLKAKNDEKEAMRKLGMTEAHNANQSSQLQKGQYTEKVTEAKQVEADIQADKIRAEDIERVMSRTPEEILSDVPVHFKAAAEVMVAGYVDKVGNVNEKLTDLKVDQKIESEVKMMELMPAEILGEVELAETIEVLPLNFEEVPAAF